jgi:nucleolar protein 4
VSLPDGAVEGARGRETSLQQWRARTVAIGGVGVDGVRNGALARARRTGALEQVSFPAPPAEYERAQLARDGCPSPEETALVTFGSVTEAREAVSKLHRGLVSHKGCLEKLWARQVGGEGSHMRAWRLIVRNVPFGVKESALENVMSPAGFVWRVELPEKEGRSRGFGFVSYTSRAHAERAVAELNGVVCKKRTLVLDWAVPKDQYQGGAGAPPPPGTGREAPVDNPDSDISDKEGRGAGAAAPNGGAGAGVEEGEDGDGGGADEALEEGEDERAKKVMARLLGEAEEQAPVEKQKKVREERHAGLGRASESRSGLGQGNESHKPFPAHNSAEDKAKVAERTVFVRNLHVDATSAELAELLERFGKVKACRVVKDKATGKPAGKAFVEFEDKLAAGQACAASDRAERGEARGLKLHMRALKIHVMLQPKDVQQLARDNTRKQDFQKDRRNLYLSKEGHIAENDPAAEGMSKEDLELRQHVFQERAEKLKRPTNSLNPCRLLLRNLPLSLDIKGLKELCLEAVKARATKASPAVVHAKVLTSEKGGKSRGRGYVEFSQPDHALTCLRHMNNNPGIFTKDRRPVVEFAVDDAHRRQHREKRLNEGGALQGGARGSKDPKRSNKRKRDDREEGARPARGGGARSKAPWSRKGEEEAKRGKRQRGEKRDEPQGSSAKTQGIKRDSRGSEKPGAERKRQKKQQARDAPAPAKSLPKNKAVRSRPHTEAGDEKPSGRAGAEGKGPKKGVSRRGQGKGEEKFDDLVSSYRKKFDTQGAGLKGWF